MKGRGQIYIFIIIPLFVVWLITGDLKLALVLFLLFGIPDLILFLLIGLIMKLIRQPKPKPIGKSSEQASYEYSRDPNEPSILQKMKSRDESTK